MNRNVFKYIESNLEEEIIVFFLLEEERVVDIKINDHLNYIITDFRGFSFNFLACISNIIAPLILYSTLQSL